MKYVMIQRTLGGLDDDSVVMCPIIFPKELVHADVAEKITQLISECWPDMEVTVVSAGEINITFGFVGGFSDTLGLESDMADDQVISSIDYFNFHRYRAPNRLNKGGGNHESKATSSIPSSSKDQKSSKI